MAGFPVDWARSGTWYHWNFFEESGFSRTRHSKELDERWAREIWSCRFGSSFLANLWCFKWLQWHLYHKFCLFRLFCITVLNLFHCWEDFWWAAFKSEYRSSTESGVRYSFWRVWSTKNQTQHDSAGSKRESGGLPSIRERNKRQALQRPVPNC